MGVQIKLSWGPHIPRERLCSKLKANYRKQVIKKHGMKCVTAVRHAPWQYYYFLWASMYYYYNQITKFLELESHGKSRLIFFPFYLWILLRQLAVFCLQVCNISHCSWKRIRSQTLDAGSSWPGEPISWSPQPESSRCRNCSMLAG